ncbi:TrkA family potassium uptake protein [Thermosulfurimonas sp. F29]|uniref:potassium channel family protein n=1 Tax=Thermosulfurimonas sp. F29 TaxID=2867247 RepID=UPI001C83226E|nr:potassium channel protein [Thermosulfurimonas sp. F29]MBX6422458.1 NAD-binding protein [Thermosulfurimonas sp. F29]
MPAFRRIGLGFLFLCILILIGVAGFAFFEHRSLFEAFYLTLMTLTTVGYGDIVPHTPAGRVLAIIVAFGGAGLFFYAVGVVSEIVLSEVFYNFFGRRQMEKKLASLKDHYIICGYGRIGKHICRLIAREVAFVVIENDPKVIRDLEREGYLFIQGDATNEEVLLKAGIEKARGVISVLRSDADNVYIVLTARSLNPRIFIMARADEEHVAKRLKQAGANKVFSPYLIGARRMALAILRPAVTDFLELTSPEANLDLQLEEMRLSRTSPLVGKDLVSSRIREISGAIILAVKKATGEMVFNPAPTYVLEPGDTLIALGRREGLSRLEKLASGER